MSTIPLSTSGGDDSAAIFAALAAAEPGDTVLLDAGTFVLTASPTVPAGVSLVGHPGTVIAVPPGYGRGILVNAGATLSTFAATGPIWIDILGSGVTVSAVTSHHSLADTPTNRSPAAFRISPPEGIIDGVTFEDCLADHTDGFGFLVVGKAHPDTHVTNITFRRCTATGCGAGENRYSTHVTGFNLCEGDRTTLAENILVEDCTATGCWESGFHVEYATVCRDCQMARCTATGNGVKPDAEYGHGILLSFGWTCTDCAAAGNSGDGFHLQKNLPPAPTDPTDPDPVRLERCIAQDNDGHGFYVSTNRVPLDDLTMSQCVVSGGADFPAVALVCVVGGQISNLRLIDCPLGFSEGEWTSGTAITYYVDPFGVAPANPYAGQVVQFADMSTFGPTEWLWSFGDGETSTLQNTAHPYAAPGAYVVSLTACGTTVSATVTVVPGVSYGGARLSEADLAPLDHDPTCTATDLHNGRVGLQGSPVSRKAWTINALADDRAEIEALAALKGQHLTLNINGTEYPGVMIRPPLLETQLTPGAWAYQVGFIQETRR